MKNNTPIGINCFSPKELSKLLGLGRTTIYKLLKENKIHSVKVGKRIIISSNAVSEFLNNEQQ